MEYLVPLSPFIMVIALVWLGAWSKARSNAAIQKTVQKAIEKGVELTPETIKALGVQGQRPGGDLRTGLILVATALGLIALGGGIAASGEEPDIIPVLAGVAAIPGFIGIVLVAMHFFMKSDKSQQ